MKLLRLLLAIAGLSFTAPAAEEEKLPDWMNIKIQVDVRKTKPRTVTDYVALAKAAVTDKTGLPVQVEFSKEILATPVQLQVGFHEASKEMSVRDYLEMVLKGAQLHRPIWEKSGEKDVKFIEVYLRTFGIYVEHQRLLEKRGALSPERLEQFLKQQGTPASRYCRIIWVPESRKILVVGLPSDIDAMEKLLRKIPGWIG